MGVGFSLMGSQDGPKVKDAVETVPMLDEDHVVKTYWQPVPQLTVELATRS